jgi:hypothetical protein
MRFGACAQRRAGGPRPGRVTHMARPNGFPWRQDLGSVFVPFSAIWARIPSHRSSTALR